MNSDNKIFTNNDFRVQVQRQAEKATSSILIFSAFVKLNAIKWLKAFISDEIEVKVVSRWLPQDLAFRASDLEVYKLCKEHSWSFGVDHTLHSKAFIFDSQTVLLGSANLTDRGLSLSRDGNLEMGTLITPTLADLDRLKLLEQNVHWVDDDVYKIFEEELDKMEIEKPKMPSWSPALIDKLQPSVDFLWVSELLHSSPQAFQWLDLDNADQLHDYELLGLNIDSFGNDEIVRAAFLTTRFYRWFKSQLQSERDNQYTNFGWLSDVLHNALLDKPPPNRSGVKQYVADFVLWLESYALEDIEIIKHDKTKSFRLNEGK